jgi:AcrR family transcriptional regulator
MSVDAATARLAAWERRRVRTALEIERAGLALMAERGLDDVTAEQVANAAGLSLRSFFRYFRNTRDLLTGVPRRETSRICGLVLARPPDEDLIDAFLAVFDQYLGDELTSDNAELELDAIRLWTDIVRRWPDAAQVLSEVTGSLGAGLEQVVRTRLAVDEDDALIPGALGAALTGVVWFTYVRWVRRGDSYPVQLDLEEAFRALAELHVVPPTRPPE